MADEDKSKPPVGEVRFFGDELLIFDGSEWRPVELLPMGVNEFPTMTFDLPRKIDPGEADGPSNGNE